MKKECGHEGEGPKQNLTREISKYQTDILLSGSTYA